MSWSKAGLFMTTLFGLWGIYANVHVEEPELLFEITSAVNVIDINKPLEDLSIFFRGEDIQKSNQNLRIYTFRVKNIGELDILQTHYDNYDIWGFEVTNGSIIELRLVESNSNYLRDNLNPILLDSNTVQFSKIIFEREEYFILEALILHDKDAAPKFDYLGKIAALNDVLIARRSESDDDRSLQEKSISLIILILKWIGVIGGILFTVAIFNLGFDKIVEIRDTKRRLVRRNQLESLLGQEADDEKIGVEYARHLFVHEGVIYLKDLKETINSDKKIPEVVRALEFGAEMDELLVDHLVEEQLEADLLDEYEIGYFRSPVRTKYPTITKMFDKGLLMLEDKKLVVDSDFKLTADHILDTFDK